MKEIAEFRCKHNVSVLQFCLDCTLVSVATEMVATMTPERALDFDEDDFDEDDDLTECNHGQNIMECIECLTEDMNRQSADNETRRE